MASYTIEIPDGLHHEIPGAPPPDRRGGRMHTGADGRRRRAADRGPSVRPRTRGDGSDQPHVQRFEGRQIR